MAMRTRLVPLAASILVAGAALAGCRVIDGGGQGSESAEPAASAGASAEASQGAAPAAPTDAPQETPLATVGTDYGY